MRTPKRMLISALALSGMSLLFGTEAQAHSKHNYHHKHSHKKAKAYNKGYRHGLKTATYGYGYRPHSRPVVVTPAPWGAPPVHVVQPNVGFGFYF